MEHLQAGADGAELSALMRLLTERGIRIGLRDDGLDIAAPKGTLTSEIKERLVRHKADLVRWLRARSGIVLPRRPDMRARISTRDLRALADSETEMRRLVEADSVQPFDLEQGPPLRVGALQLEDEHFVLLINLHHIVGDGQSMEILAREVVALYHGERTGMPAELPALPLQYGDYAAWQRQRLDASSLATLQAFWQEWLRDASMVHAIPTDHPRPPQPSHRGAGVSLTLSEASARGLRALSRRGDATLFSTLFTAFALAQHRFGGAADVLVGTVAANRDRAELDGLIGFFVNTVVLRATVDSRKSFRQLVAAVAEDVRAAFGHQDLPFEQLVELLKPTRDPAMHPVFQLMFTVVQAADADDAAEPGDTQELRLEPIESEPFAKFDLSFAVHDRRDGLHCALAYATDLFEEASALRLLETYRGVVDAVVANPDTPIQCLFDPVPGVIAATADVAAPGAQAWFELHGKGEELPVPEVGVHRLFEAQAEASAERTAVVFGEASITYADLNSRANALARELRALGVGPERLVGLYLPRCIDQMIGVLAIWKAGGAYVPLDPAHPAGRLQAMLADAEPVAILTHTALVDRLPETSAAVLALDAAGPWENQSSANLDDAGDPQRLAYVLYTSGSTGTPKGVEIVHGALTSLSAAWRHQRGATATPGRRVAINAPMVFDVSVQQLLQLLDGATLYPVPEQTRLDIDALWRFLADSRLDEFDCTPSLLQVLLDTMTPERIAALPKLLLVGGEAISERQWRQLLALREHGVEACNGYGPTECTVYTTYGAIVPESPLPVIGRPVPNLRLYVLDEHGAACSVGDAGELCVAGWGVARGYRARAELTAERFVQRNLFGREERVYRTGDWVRWKDDGTLEYLGRRDGQIKLRGFRIELGEITAALEAQPGVRQAVVIVAGQGAAAQLVAYVVGEADGDTLARALSQRLPAYMVPGTWMSLDSLPLNTNGKVDTRALPAPAVAIREFVAPQDAVEQAIATIFEELLEQAPIGLHDNFFALGGHSLLAMRAAVRINQALGVDLPAYRLFDLATVAQLAPVVRALQDDGPVEAIPRHRGDRRRIPLSHAQQRVWLFDRVMVTRRGVFNIPEQRTIAGPLDVERLRAAFNTLIRRHESLRTRFFEEDDRTWQCVEDEVVFDLPLHDLSDDPTATESLQALAFDDAQHSFVLQQAPLLRANLVRLDVERHVLLVNIHHIVSDGLSQNVLWDELAACYRGDELPALPVQYGDFAAWAQAKRMETSIEASLAYWRRTLADLPPCHGLPLSYPRPAQPGLLATTVRCCVEEQAALALRQLGQDEHTTLFMTLLAGFQVLLARSTGDADIVVGTPVSIRPRTELEGLIGLFVDTLVLRQTIDHSLTFRALLQQVRGRVLAAYQHPDVPFEQVVQALAPERTLSHHPLFQILFSVEPEPVGSAGWQPMPVISEQPPQFDLTLVVREGNALTCNLTYCDDLFAPPAMVALLDQYTRLLAAVAANPDRPLAELSLLDAQDEAWLQAHGKGEELPVPEVGVHRLFEAQAEASAERTAVVFGEASITYADLNSRANALARELRALGVGPERLVGLYLPRCIDQMIGVLAIWKAGGAYVPLDPAHPAGRLQAMLADAEPVAILTHTALVDRLPETSAAVLALDAAGPWENQSSANLDDAGDPQRLAYVLYTSGSTGTPKGVEIVHGALTSLSAAWRHQRGATATPGRRVAINAPMVFDVSVQQLLQLLDGATLYPVPEQTRLDIDALWRFLADSRLDEFDCTPSLLQVLLDTMTPERIAALPKLLLVGGEAISERQWRQLLALREHGVEACNGYGPTECTVYTTYGAIVPESPLPVIGRPVPNLRLYVLDEHGAACSVGDAGELCVAGWGVARGYRARAELTAERFVQRNLFGREERVYRTGDWVRWKDDGTLEYLGRRDGQIKLRGFRIELGEITAALEAQPGVRQAVVIVAGQGAAAQLVAYVVGEADGDTLARALSQRLPAYMVPGTWMSLDSLPLNTNGKVDTRALPAPAVAIREFVAPQDAVEQAIATIFEELLEQAPIGLHDNFFALGGHSLLAMRAAVRINQALGVDLPAYRLFDLATVAQLAPVVRALQDDGPVEAIPRHRGDRRRIPLSPAQQRLWLVEKMAGGTRGVYNMPIHLRVRGALDIPALERAFQGLIERHEILRTRFVEIDGQPLQCVEPADGSRHAPMSFAQRQLWLIDRLESRMAPGLYNIPLHLRLHGAIDADALEHAFTALIARHEILRTRFDEIDGEPMQCIDPPHPLRLERHDLRGNPQARKRLFDLARADMAEGFDLQRGPLLRAQLLQLADDEHVLLACVHHIAADGWSMDVLAREMGQLYESIVKGQTTTLAPLPVQYGDYAHWQRSRSTDLEPQLAWWQRTLTDLPLCHSLPTARSRPAQQSHRGATVCQTVSAEVATAVQALGQQERATAFMTLLAAFQLLVARCSGSSDVVVGTPVTNRPHPSLEGLIGFFVNTLVLRQQVDASLSFRALLRQVRENVLAAYQRQDVPFEQVVQALRPERSGSHHPLFQLMFSAERAAAEGSGPGPQMQGLGDTDSGTDWAKFDLQLTVREGAELSCSLTYATELFDQDAMQQLLVMYERLLAAVTTDPDRPLSQLTLLDAQELTWLQAQGTGDVLPACEVGVHRLFEAQVARSGDHPAVVFGEESVSYAALNARANALAHELRALGVGPERLVAIYLPRSINQTVAVLAIWKAGGAYVPLDAAHPPGRLQTMLADAEPVAILTHADLAVRLPSTSAPVLVLDAPGPWETRSRSNLADDGDRQRLAYVLYTSGSTGTPKGVEIEHGALTSLAAAWRHTRGGHAPGRRVASNAPLAFDMSVQQLLQLLDGATLYPVPEYTRLDIEALWCFLIASRLDEFDFTPSLLQVLLDTMTPERLPHLPKLLLFGGEAASPRLWQQLLALREHGIQAYNGYGPTECTVYTTYGPVLPSSPQPMIGRPVPNLRLYVLDENGVPCGVGVPGELHVAGAGVARGYRARPDLTAERFVQCTVFGRNERVYRTGDWVRWKDDGTLDYLGRSDGQIKLRGFRIELGEVTAALESQPGVRQAAVVLAGQGAAAQLVAYVVGDAEGGVLATALGQRLPAYMVPTAWMHIDTLPLNLNGKVDTRALPAPILAPRETVAPQGEIEETIAAIFEAVLEHAPVSVHDNFFALGGHSLLAMRAAVRINEALGVDLAAYRLFDLATVAQLAPVVRSMQGRGRSDSIEPYRGDRRHMPLSLAQQRLWLVEKMAGGTGGLYNIVLHLRLLGALDANVLEQALTALVERHEVLRTRFVEIDEEPTQCVDPPQPLALPRHDLRGQPDRETLARAMARADAEQGFDLQHDLPIRAQLLQLAEDDHVLLACVHHIAADGWSLDVLARELGALYDAIKRGQPSPLPALPVQYGDYAHWQRSRLADPESQIAWWRQTLVDLPSCHTLPTARPRPAQPSHRGATVSHSVTADVTARVQTLAQQERATAFMTLLAAFQVLVARASGAPDVVVGTPVANRPHPVLEGLIGFFVNTVVLRQQVDTSLSFRALLRQVRDAVLAAYEHQDAPFEQLVQALQPERGRGLHPLFQLMFSAERAATDRSNVDEEGEGLQLRRFGDDDSGNGDSGDWAKFDLSLVVREGTELACSLTYATDLFDAPPMQRLLLQYGRLLAAATSEPDRPLAELSLLDAQDEAWLQAHGKGEELPVPEVGVHRLFEAQAEASAERTAVVFGEGSITYADLNSRANALARELRALGVGPERLVGLYLPRCIDQMIGVLAIWKAGGAYVPLDPAHPPGRLQAMLADAEPVAILTHTALVDRLPETSAAVLALDAAGPWENRSSANLDDAGDPQRLAYVLYTSGSTGTPKGVEIVHGALTSLSAAWRHQRGATATPGRRVAINAPMVFDVSVQQLLQLLDGATLYPVPEQTRLDIDALWRFLADSRLDEFDCTPSLLQVLLDTMTPERIAALPKLLLVGGEAISERQWRQLLALREHGIEACNGYGPTECTVYTTYGAIVPESPLPVIGRPVPNLRLYVLDEHGAACSVGDAGELCVAGWGVARGYRARAELTAERFVQRNLFGREERVYRTGDWVRWKDDGTLEYLGRRDGQIKLRGFRIELGEITAALEAQPGVRQAVVIVAGQGAAAQLVAYVVGEADGDTLARALSQRLPAYMVPGTWMSLDSLPLNTNGKVDTRALPAPAVAIRTYAAPRNATECTLQEIWQRVLQHSPIGIHDSFFGLGGHSLLAVRMLAEVRRALGGNVTVGRLLGNDTITGLAGLLTDDAPAESPGLIVLRPGLAGASPALLIPPVGGGAACYHPLARAFPPQQAVYAGHVDVQGGMPLLDDSVPAAARRYLDALLAQAADPPTCLLGWSMGGVVAHEIAAQMLDRGLKPPLLVMIDSHAPRGDTGNALSERGVAATLAAELGLHDDAFEWSEEGGVEALHGVLLEAGLLPAALDVEQLRRRLSVIRHHLGIAGQHRPRRIDAPTVLYKAMQQRGTRPDNGWTAHVAQLRVHEVDADHFAIMRGTEIARIARDLEAVFDGTDCTPVRPKATADVD